MAKYMQTREDREEAASDHLNEQIDAKLNDMILQLEQEEFTKEAIELLNWDRRRLICRIDEIWTSDYLKRRRNGIQS